MNGSGWLEDVDRDSWRLGPSWLQPLSVAVPWLTVMLLAAMLWLASRTYGLAGGLLFELPDAAATDAVGTELVALVVPMPRETLVFFDDARYMVGDDASLTAFGEHLESRRKQAGDEQTLLVLADRRVSGGDLMKLAALARRRGFVRVLFAAKPSGGVE